MVEVSAGGQVFRERVDIPRGDCRNPLTDDELDQKFVSAVEFAGTGWNAQALLADYWDCYRLAALLREQRPDLVALGWKIADRTVKEFAAVEALRMMREASVERGLARIREHLAGGTK